MADILKYYETQEENNNIKIAKTVIKEILKNDYRVQDTPEHLRTQRVFEN